VTDYRADLPPIPTRMLRLPVVRGYPVPWFVDKVNGLYDFRIADSRKRGLAVRDRLCWQCGQRLGRYLAFVIGPMCAINRISSEPPSHRACAEFAVKACPFLTQREDSYREAGLPAGVVSPPGHAIFRQPGVALIWITETYKLIAVDGDYLIRFGEPTETLWFREGRPATRAEVLTSIDSGCPTLQNAAIAEGRAAVARFERDKAAALQFLPAA
jgi:hypothetical protein